MTSWTARRATTLLAAAVLALSIVPAGVSAGSPAEDEPAVGKPHCVSLVSAPRANGASTVVKNRCYRNLAPALRAAAPGAIIPDDVEASQISDTLLAPVARVDPRKLTTIIGIQWEHTDRGGRDRIYYVKGGNPCANNRVWQIGKLDAGWDRIVSSAEGFGGCDTFVQFEHVKFRGTSRQCTPYCASLGSLNDEVSSVRWRS